MMKRTCVTTRIGDGEAPGGDEGAPPPSWQAISRILASRATMLAPILVITRTHMMKYARITLGLARVLACSPRITARVLQWGGDEGMRRRYISNSGGLRAVPASG